MVKRVMPKIKQICQREENRVAIVTHGGVIRSVCAGILHTGQENKLKFGIDLENTSFTHLIYDEDRDFLFWSVLMILLIWSLIRVTSKKLENFLGEKWMKTGMVKKIRNWQFSYSQPFV